MQWVSAVLAHPFPCAAPADVIKEGAHRTRVVHRAVSSLAHVERGAVGVWLADGFKGGVALTLAFCIAGLALCVAADRKGMASV
jgi:hypothetical protein